MKVLGVGSTAGAIATTLHFLCILQLEPVSRVMRNWKSVASSYFLRLDRTVRDASKDRSTLAPCGKFLSLALFW